MRKILIILFFVFFVGTIYPFLQAKENLVKKAQKSMDFMGYKQAGNYLSQAILADPDKKDIRVMQGFAYFKLGKHDYAIKVLKEELTLFPDNFNAFILLGYVYFNQAKIKEASDVCQDFSTALEKTVREESLKRYSKSSFRDKKELLEKILEKISKKTLNFGLPNFILGFYHKKGGSFDQASENFHLALERGYNPVECHIQLIDIELIRKEWKEGLKKSVEALEAEGTQAEFYFLMGYAHYHLGEIENAVSCFKTALELKPYLLSAIKNLAKIYYNQDEFEKATPLLKKILIPAPYDYEVKFLLEDTLRGKSAQKEENRAKLSKETMDKVELEFKYIFKTDINYVARAVNEIALTFVRSGQSNKAINWIRSFFEVYDLSPELNYNLGKLYNIRNILGEALKYAWRAKEIKKDYRQAYDSIGNIFYKMHDFENSLQYYKEFIKMDPKDGWGYYNLGCVYYAMKDLEKAEESWKNAIKKEKRKKKERKKEKSFKDELDMSLIVETRPVSFDSHKSLGSLYLQQNLKENALEEFKKAVELEPADPEPYYEIGKIYYELNNTKETTFYFEKYLYLGGKEEKVKDILKKLKADKR